MSKGVRKQMRTGIISSLLVVILLGGSLCMGGCLGNEQATQAESQEKLPLSADLQKILEYGSMAPSSHNAQMWKVKVISDEEIEILLDEQRQLSEVDPVNREALISLGAFIENIIQASPYYGMAPQLSIFDEIDAQGRVARIVFHQTKKDDSELNLIAMKNRHTIREKYLLTSLRSDDRSALQASVPDSLYFPLESSEGQYIKESHVAAVIEQSKDQGVQKELAEWVRYSKEEVNTKKDGLSPETMGLSALKQKLFYLFVNEKNFVAPSSVKQGIAQAEQQAENCAGYVLLTGEASTVQGLIEVGRNLERLLLEATRRQIAVQPMSAVHELPASNKDLNEKIKASQPVEMILRVGYVKDYGEASSKRRDLSEIILFEN